MTELRHNELGALVMAVGAAASVCTERCLVTYVYRTPEVDYCFTVGPEAFKQWERDAVLRRRP
jgi:hypothetical protein